MTSATNVWPQIYSDHHCWDVPDTPTIARNNRKIQSLEAAGRRSVTEAFETRGTFNYGVALLRNQTASDFKAAEAKVRALFSNTDEYGALAWKQRESVRRDMMVGKRDSNMKLICPEYAGAEARVNQLFGATQQTSARPGSALEAVNKDLTQ